MSQRFFPLLPYASNDCLLGINLPLGVSNMPSASGVLIPIGQPNTQQPHLQIPLTASAPPTPFLFFTPRPNPGITDITGIIAITGHIAMAVDPISSPTYLNLQKHNLFFQQFLPAVKAAIVTLVTQGNLEITAEEYQKLYRKYKSIVLTNSLSFDSFYQSFSVMLAGASRQNKANWLDLIKEKTGIDMTTKDPKYKSMTVIRSGWRLSGIFEKLLQELIEIRKQPSPKPPTPLELLPLSQRPQFLNCLPANTSKKRKKTPAAGSKQSRRRNVVPVPVPVPVPVSMSTESSQEENVPAPELDLDLALSFNSASDSSYSTVDWELLMNGVAACSMDPMDLIK